jgi:hypothetical protein
MTILHCEILQEEDSLSCHVPWDSFTSSSRVPQGPTDELVTWIGKINQKMRVVRSSRSLDLRKETLLATAKAAAQATLRARQSERRQRWEAVCNSWGTNEEEAGDSLEEETTAEEPEGSLCDCSCCILCQRHLSQMFGKCYCHVIFSPSPVMMDFSLTPVTDLFVNVDESREVDNFLASLSSGGKRKCSVEAEEERNEKRCKA